MRWRSATNRSSPDRDLPVPKASRRYPSDPTPWQRARRQRTGICGALPFRRSAATERDLDMSRTEHDALDLQSHEIAVAEFQQRGRLAWGNLLIDVANLMPNGGDNQFFDVWSRDAGDAACILLAVLQHSLRDIVAIAHVAVARAWLAETAKLRARQIGEFEVTRPDAEPG